MDHQSAEEICQQVFGGEADRDTAHAAEGQHAGNAEAQRLHHRQCGKYHHHDAQYFAHAINRGAIDVATRLGAGVDIVFRKSPDQFEQEPCDTQHDADAARRCDVFE